MDTEHRRKTTMETKNEVPAHLVQFQHENFGVGACLTAARYAVAHPDETVTLELWKHDGAWTTVSVLRFGFTRLNGSKTVRWASEHGRLTGAGSHAILATGRVETAEQAAVETALVLANEAGRQHASPAWVQT
jgi:hypothetical protein